MTTEPNLPPRDAPHSPLEDALLRLPQPQLRPAVMADIKAAVTSGIPARRPVLARWWPLATLAAAALFIVLWNGSMWNHSATPNQTPVTVAAPVAVDPQACCILKVIPAPAALVAQSLADFSIAAHPLPCQLGGQHIQAVTGDTLQCQSKSISLADWNRAAMAGLAAECAAHTERFKAGLLQPQDLQRLARLSAYGVSAAANLLQEIAATNSTLGAAAERLGCSARGIQQIETTAAWARRGSREARLAAIRSLAPTHAPLACIRLKELAEQSDDEMLAAASVNALYECGGSQSLGSLQALSTTATLPSARQLSLQRLEELLKESSR